MTVTTTRLRTWAAALAVALPLGMAALPTRAQDELILVETVRTTTFVNGGVGKDEAAQMRRMASEWPLRMTFTERRDNEFVAGVALLVTDQRGAPVLLLQSAGPMTYVMLPAGRYRIAATFKGVTESREVTLDGKQGWDVSFHWRGGPKFDPWDGRPVGGRQVPG